MIIGCFSPLIKIFLPSFWVPVLDEKGQPVLDEHGKPKEKRVKQTELLQNPTRIVEDEQMRFEIPRSVGAYHMRLNRPVNLDDKNLAVYLTGDDIGQQLDEEFRIHTETDCYGVAAIPLRSDVQGMLVASLASGDGAAEQLLLEERKQAKEAHDRAIKISHHRCVRAAKKMVAALKDQRQKDSESNRGSYVPSPSEYLAAYYLAEQESEEAEKMRAVVDQFSGMMDKIEQKGLQLGR